MSRFDDVYPDWRIADLVAKTFCPRIQAKCVVISSDRNKDDGPPSVRKLRDLLSFSRNELDHERHAKTSGYDNADVRCVCWLLTVRLEQLA